VIINLNPRILGGEAIQVWWNGQRLTDPAAFRTLLDRVEKLVPLGKKGGVQKSDRQAERRTVGAAA
jgi:hypothetical protein